MYIVFFRHVIANLIDYSSNFQLVPCHKRHSGAPQEFLKHEIPDYVEKGTDLFSLRLSNQKMTIANITIAI